MNRPRLMSSLETPVMKSTLLIAEGDDQLAGLMGRFLSRQGHDVEVVSDGLECMARLRQLTPDVLVLDVGLPWGGGDGVLSCLHEESNVPPAIILTTWGDSFDVLEGLTAAPVVRCLRKPFALAALLQCIRTVRSDVVMERLKRDRDADRACLA